MTLSDAAPIVLSNLAIVLVFLTMLWLVSVRIKNASIIDIAWGPACAAPALLTFARVDGAEPRAAVLTFLVSLWAARLALYLAQRNIGHGADIRYQQMRSRQGSDRAMAWWSLPNVYWLQGLIAWFISLPVQLGQFGADAPLGPLAWLGVAVFTIGLSFEAIGDWQLKTFKAKPANKGKLMTKGLWAYTRHPNYFGDAAVWTGLTLVAIEGALGVWTVLSPLVMTFFLVKVSGKALTERIMAKKYPEYGDYRARVSGFFPLPPKT